jgi:hypothetical protein
VDSVDYAALTLERRLGPSTRWLGTQIGTRLPNIAARTTLLGALNSLSQLALKSLLPGVRDFYQGTELWDLSLVDPRGHWRGGRFWPWWDVGAGVALAAATWPYYGGYGYGYDSCIQWLPDYGWVNVCNYPYYGGYGYY